MAASSRIVGSTSTLEPVRRARAIASDARELISALPSMTSAAWKTESRGAPIRPRSARTSAARMSRRRYVGQRPGRDHPLLRVGDRGGLRGTDPDRQVATAVPRPQEHDRLVRWASLPGHPGHRPLSLPHRTSGGGARAGQLAQVTVRLGQARRAKRRMQKGSRRSFLANPLPRRVARTWSTSPISRRRPWNGRRWRGSSAVGRQGLGAAATASGRPPTKWPSGVGPRGRSLEGEKWVLSSAAAW